jgi:ribosomal protein L29
MRQIKLDPKEIKKKSIDELRNMLKEMKFHMVQGSMPSHTGKAGFSPKEERRNIARIETELREREMNEKNG